MNYIKSTLIAPALAVLLSTTLLAAESYTIENQSLKEAIEVLSKKSNTPYMVDGKLLQGKKAPNIKNIEGLENALKKVLQGTNLEAVIEDGTILIRKKSMKKKSSSNLGSIDVIEQSNVTEGSGSYTIQSMNTSTRLNLSIKETPQSIKVLTHQKIIDKNIQSFEDIASSTAGISMSKNYQMANHIYSRGFQVDYYQIDGSPTIYNANQENLMMYDRVEIVKGANGLISGAGNPAVSINYIKKHAKSKDFKASLQLEAGSWNSYGTTVDLSSGLNKSGSIRGRIIASYKQNDSFIDELNEKDNTVYTTFEADLNDNTLLSLTLSKQKFNNENDNGAGVPIYFSDGSKTNFSKSSNFSGKDDYNKYTNTTAALKLEHIFNNDVKLITNYTYSKNNVDEISFWNRRSFPNKTTGILTINPAAKQDYTSKNHALDIYASIPFALANRKHEFITGLMYSKNDIHDIYSDDTGSSLSSNVYNWDNSTNLTSFEEWGNFKKETKQLGMYSVGNFSLSDDIKLIAGARVSNWEYNTEEQWSGGSIEKETFKFNNNITPFLGLVYNLNEQHSIYTSYTSIFKPQTGKKDTSGKHLDPKEGNSYEVGLKSTFFDDSINSSISLFRIEQDNLAVEDGSNVILNTTNQAYKLAKGVVSKGIEIDIAGEINDNWNVDFGLAYFDAVDQEGKTVNEDQPKTQITLSTKYTLNKISLGAGINWQSKFYEEATNPGSSKEERNYQESYYLVNTMAKYDIKDNLSIQANINNLFNKTYYSNIMYGTRYRFGEPRNVTLKLNYTF